MHLIDYQYLKVITTKLKVAEMHDLYVIYRKVKRTVKKSIKQNLVHGDNLMLYPNRPRMSDLEIISLSITSECLGIDSENLLFSKIKKDYSKSFQNLIHRTQYNSRRKSLRDWILYCSDKWGEELTNEETNFIVDSIPISISKVSRAPRSTVCRKEVEEVNASQGYDSTIKQYFRGFRMHLIVSSSGVYQHIRILPANVHDINYLKELEETHL